jgi:hypothetical protein
MSRTPAVLACPVCGGDQTSVAMVGELYCVECNRRYAIINSRILKFSSPKLAAKPAESLRIVLPVKRAA